MMLRTQTFHQYLTQPIPADSVVVAQFTDEDAEAREGVEILVFEACETLMLE